MNTLALILCLAIHLVSAQQASILLSNEQISFICAKHIMAVKDYPLDGDVALITPYYTGFLRKFGTEIYQVIKTTQDHRFIAQEVTLTYPTHEIFDMVTRWDGNVREVDKKYYRDMSQQLKTVPDSEAYFTEYTLDLK